MARPEDHAFRHPPVGGAAGFTLIELLLVILILGISAAVIAPRLGGMMDGGRSAVAARSVAETGRYARTMALLNQLPMDLVLDLDNGSVAAQVGEIKHVSSDGSDSMIDIGAGRGSAGGFGLAQSRDERREAELKTGFRTPKPGAEPLADASLLDDEPGGLAAELEMKRKLDAVRLGFGGYVDRADLPGADATTNGVVRVRYRSNGTCRPYRVVVMGERTGESLVIDVDAVGTPQVQKSDETGRTSR